MLAGRLAQMAAAWIGRKGIQANIITSMGLASQTVFHTDVHVVPLHRGRRAGAALDRPADRIDGDEGTVCPVHRDWHPSPVCDPVEANYPPTDLLKT
jgi:diadenosine tetraphosphate (Ap4A) HIT family hydrolase